MSLYYFVTNLQGDVVRITNAQKETLANYSYDAYGKLLSVTNASGTTISDTSNIALINPLRYRGYYYDSETELYYLQSRYYDPTTSRFINADSYLSTGQDFLGFNSFAYCLNNPVIAVDSSGSAAKVCLTDDTSLALMKPTANPSGGGGWQHSANRRPNTGAPGSTYTTPDGDTRTYGPDGKPAHDYDHDDHGYPDKHPHDEKGGHNHDWNNGIRGPAYCINTEAVFGCVVIVGLICASVVIIADDATGLGAADDFLLVVIAEELGRWFGKLF